MIGLVKEAEDEEKNVKLSGEQLLNSTSGDAGQDKAQPTSVASGSTIRWLRGAFLQARLNMAEPLSAQDPRLMNAALYMVYREYTKAKRYRGPNERSDVHE